MNTDSNSNAGMKSPGVPAMTKGNPSAAKRRNGSPGRRETEKVVFQEMTRLFCRAQHRQGDSCPDCDALVNYAWQRIEACRFEDAKPFCSACTVHCFSSDRRDQTRMVMRYAGPRMLFHHPIMAIRHLLLSGQGLSRQ